MARFNEVLRKLRESVTKIARTTDTNERRELVAEMKALLKEADELLVAQDGHKARTR
jgi:hypothetical protein